MEKINTVLTIRKISCKDKRRILMKSCARAASDGRGNVMALEQHFILLYLKIELLKVRIFFSSLQYQSC